MKSIFTIMLAIVTLLPLELISYPIDGYEITGIRRLLYLEKVQKGEITGMLPKAGGLNKIEDIQLNLLGQRGDSVATLPKVNVNLQKSIDALFPNLDENYSIALLDIADKGAIRYASKKEKTCYQPGSVAKLIIVAALFNELNKLYPNCFADRQNLLKSKYVQGGTWVNTDEHTIPVFNIESNVLTKRIAKELDVFNLYEWTDHMLSVSNNGAACVVWREIILMHVFGLEYVNLTQEKADEYFRVTPKATLTKMAVELVNEPLLDLGISKDEFRLGSFFTSGAKKIIPPVGGSIASPSGLIKYLIAMERGKLIDEQSSLEIKRLMYMTGNRIRYASSSALNTSAVYFKSGSLYQCRPEAGYECQKYMGNFNNYMNSVIIVEHSDGTKYMVALMSNVLKKNSASDHIVLASGIDKAVRKR